MNNDSRPLKLAEPPAPIPVELRETLHLAHDDLRFRSIVEGVGDLVWEIDAEGNFTFVNGRISSILGYEPAEVVGTSYFAGVNAEEAARVAGKMKLFTKYHREFTGLERSCLHADGTMVVFESAGVPFFDAAGVFRGYRGVDRDITARKKAEVEIRHQAYHDPLTGLPNRILFNDRLKLAILNARRNRQKLAVMFLDLDCFKGINDSFGHAAGDTLLVAVADRLVGTLRQCDTIARLGGDEFVVLLPVITSEKNAARVAKKLMNSLEQPITCGPHHLSVSCSLGISVYPSDGEEPSTLLDHADCAMYRAKRGGKRNFRFFDPEMETDAAGDMALEESMKHILELGQLELFYQPQVDLATGRVHGMEALLRWRHPELGIISPERFIPLAEETGTIVPIGEWVMQSACEQNKKWQQAGFPPLRMTVNVSAQEFRQRVLHETISRVLDDTDLHPSHLSLDIPEGLAMEQVEGVMERLQQVADIGVQISLDDFGTSRSSMRLLRKMPVRILKIHRSILANVESCPDDRAVVRAAIKMAHCLDMEVIAEGVETPEQLAFLREADCDFIQGFLVSPPLPPREIEVLVQTAECLC